MKKIMSMLVVLAIFGSAEISVSIPIAKADTVSNVVATEFLKYYKRLRKKAKGDKKKLSALLSISKATLKKINRTPGMAARSVAVKGVQKMRLVVK